ncbi:MAG: hypothetical protein MZW92_21805 [Comamonadaceae bacterium]|nr:hypothetical protein [Comamonadaceae bacterium]
MVFWGQYSRRERRALLLRHDRGHPVQSRLPGERPGAGRPGRRGPGRGEPARFSPSSTAASSRRCATRPRPIWQRASSRTCVSWRPCWR